MFPAESGIKDVKKIPLQNTGAPVMFIRLMVDVAQLVELWVVASAVVGSSPIIHPIETTRKPDS